MTKCPHCGVQISKPGKEWDYSLFHVKMFRCPKCGKSLRAYYKDGKLNHTIPKGKNKLVST